MVLSASRRIEYDWSPSERLSPTPVIVTFESAFQFDEVKVMLSTSTVPSPGSEETT